MSNWISLCLPRTYIRRNCGLLLVHHMRMICPSCSLILQTPLPEFGPFLDLKVIFFWMIRFEVWEGMEGGSLGSVGGGMAHQGQEMISLILEVIISYFHCWKPNFACLYRERVWATFPRQEEAMRFSKAHAQSKVFSYQDYLTGQRRFLVSTYDEFWGRLES